MGLCLSNEQFSVYVFGTEITLSRKEFLALRALMQNEGKIMSREQLLDAADIGLDKNNRAVDSMIKRLRAKLFKSPEARAIFIESRNGLGYRIPGRR
ncbi:MAG: winged helix-turn-helix domain-containing protein [Candidatus Paceibacteria bacterium]